MGRPRISSSGEKKVKLSTSIDPGLYAWVEENTGAGRRFATITHAIEMGIARLRDEQAESMTRQPDQERASAFGRMMVERITAQKKGEDSPSRGLRGSTSKK